MCWDFFLNPPISPKSPKLCTFGRHFQCVTYFAEFGENWYAMHFVGVPFSPKSPKYFQHLVKCMVLGTPKKKVTWLIQKTSVMTSFGKVSMQVLTYGVEFATDKVQETMTHEFFEFLETWLLIYVDNMLVHTLTRRAHLEALRTLFERCKRINIHIRKEKCSFLQQSIKTMGLWLNIMS